MITTIDLIRHPETEQNLRQSEIIGGRSNHIPLSDNGFLQIEALTQRFLRTKVAFDAIYASPALRTQLLAQAVHVVLVDPPDIVTIDDIQEVFQGDWEGQPRHLHHTPDVIQQIIAMKGHHKAPNGESAVECGLRGLAFAENCRDLHQGQHIAWFTHGYLIKATLAQIQKSDPLLTHFTEIDNTSITTIKYHHEKKSWGIARVNDAAHLE